MGVLTGVAVVSILCALLATPSLAASLRNVTIDDADTTDKRSPAVIYAGDWIAVSNSMPCAVCEDQPDISQFSQGTYHGGWISAGDKDDLKTITVSFTGVAFYVVFALCNEDWSTNVHFVLDGSPISTYSHNVSNISSAGSQRTYQYNRVIFNQTNLENKQHYLIIASNEGDNNMMLFDTLIYSQVADDISESSNATATFPVVSPSETSQSLLAQASSSDHNRLKRIIGAIVGALAGIGLTGILIAWIRIRRHRILTQYRNSFPVPLRPGFFDSRVVGNPQRQKESAHSSPQVTSTTCTSPNAGSRSITAEVTRTGEQVSRLLSELWAARIGASAMDSDVPPPYAK